MAGAAWWTMAGAVPQLVEHRVLRALRRVLHAPRLDWQPRVQQRTEQLWIESVRYSVVVLDDVAILVRVIAELAIRVPSRRRDRRAEHLPPPARITRVQAGAHRDMGDRHLRWLPDQTNRPQLGRRSVEDSVFVCGMRCIDDADDGESDVIVALVEGEHLLEGSNRVGH